MEISVNVAPIQVQITQDNKSQATESGPTTQSAAERPTGNTKPQFTDDDQLSDINDRLKNFKETKVEFGEEKG
jgi:hypothetical protein